MTMILRQGVSLFSTPSNKSLAFSDLSAKITASSAVNEEVVRSKSWEVKSLTGIYDTDIGNMPE